MGRKGVIGLSVGGVLVVLLVVALLLFEPWLLFVDNETDEDLPGGAKEVVTATGGLEDTTVPSPAGEDDDPEDAPLVELASADFISAEHATSGRAQILREGDGTRYLRLEDLNTSNGPDLHVWITDQPSGGDCEGCQDSWGIYDDGDYIALGELKANQGSQNYEIPDDADLGGMTSVVIWCDRFNVAFGTAQIG